MSVSTFAQSSLDSSQQPVSVNHIINGGFNIWQRGTSFNGDNFPYTADRWRAVSNAAATYSRQSAGLTGFQFSIRGQRNSGSTSTTGLALNNTFESINSISLAGKTMTLSFYARRGANLSANLSSYVLTGTGTDQTPYAGFTGQATASSVIRVLETNWVRYAQTFTLIPNLTQITVGFTYTPTGTAGANDWFELAGVQLEEGSEATPFRNHSPSIQAELAACQRYFEKSYPQEVAPGTSNANAPTFYGSTDSFANIVVRVPLSVRKRNSSYTLTMYLFEGASGQVFYARNGASGNVTPQPYRFNENSFHAYAPTGAAWVVAQTAFHWTVSNEL